MSKPFKRYLVTSALPYANGPVHIGHLAGVYIPSDIYTRYLRLKGYDVISVCGSDEHGVPITIKARKEGVTPQQIVDRYHQLIKSSFEGLGMSFDIYSRTSSKTHAATASEFFRKLYDEGKFIERTSEQYYDEETQTFLADRYIVGTCPRCGNDRAYGDQCEKCGSTLSPDELINPHSAVSGSVPVKRATKHWYLPLDQYEGFLREWILEGHKEWKTNVYGQCKSWLDGGLQPRAVSRDLDWGIPVPVEGAEGKVLYVWFDAPIGYISATKDLTPDWEKYWKDEETKMVHFIGKDNIVFHSQIWPSEMLAYNGQGSKGGETGKLGPLNMPEQVVASEFMTMEGKKFSSSRGIVIYVKDILSRYPVDAVRYYISVAGPESSDSDFTWAEFVRHNNEELAASWGNLVNRVANLMNKNFGEIPALDEASMTDEDRALLAETAGAFDSIGSLIENHRQKNALSEAMRVVGDINKYISATEPWKIKDNPARLGTVLHVAAQAVSDANHLLAPFLPHSAQKVWEALGGAGTFSPLPELKEVEDLDKPGFTYPIITGNYELGVNVHPWKSEAIEVGAVVPKPTPIFAKIPTEAVKEELARFDEALAARRAVEAERLAAEKAKLAAE